MQDAMLVVIVAAFVIYVVGLLSKRGPALNFLSLITTASAVMGVIGDRVELGDYFLVILLPLMYIMLSSIVAFVSVKSD